MKQKTTYQKPEIQQVRALTAGGFAQSPESVQVNAATFSSSSSDVNEYSTSNGSWN